MDYSTSEPSRLPFLLMVAMFVTALVAMVVMLVVVARSG